VLLGRSLLGSVNREFSSRCLPGWIFSATLCPCLSGRNFIRRWDRHGVPPGNVSWRRGGEWTWGRSKRPGRLVPLVLSDLRIDGRRAEAEIVKVWNNLLDPDIVAHAQPVGVHKGTLFVAVDSSPWLSEIVRYRRKGILERLRHSFGPELIKKISFRIG
jgi:hypothetical protein